MTNDNTSTETNDNAVHLNFEDNASGNWKKHFQEESTIRSIMDVSGLGSSHDFSHIKSRYVVNDNRVSIIAVIKHKKKNVLDKLIIDVIAGDPTIEQLTDVVYGIGSDCDYRMILYDKNTDNKVSYFRINCDDMPYLISYLDEHVLISLIEVDIVKNCEGDMKVNYSIIASTKKCPTLLSMPKREAFDYAELFCLGPYFDPYVDDIMFNSRVEDGESLTSYTEWQETGTVTEIEIESDDFIWLFTQKIDEVKSDDCTYEYDKEKGILKICDNNSFKNFKNAPPEKKSYLADDYYRCARVATWLEELLYERNEEENKQTIQCSNCKASLILPKASN